MMKLAIVLLLFTFASGKIAPSEEARDLGSRVDLGLGEFVDGKTIGFREGLNAEGHLIFSLFKTEIIYAKTITKTKMNQKYLTIFFSYRC